MTNQVVDLPPSEVETSSFLPVPPYVSFWRNTGALERYANFVPGAAGLVLMVAYEAIRAIAGHQATANERIALYGGTLSIVTGAFFLARAYRSVKGAATVFRSQLREPEDVANFDTALRRMFGAPWQYPFAGLFSLALVTFVYHLDSNLVLPSLVLFLVLAVVAGLISGFGVGLALTSMAWMWSIKDYRSLRLFLLPGRTPALRETARLTGIFALYFSLQSAIEITVFLLMRWSSPLWVQIVRGGLMYPVIGIAVVFFAYPQLAIRRIIVRAKQIELEQIAKGHEVFFGKQECNKRLTGNELEQRDLVTHLYARIAESPSTALDAETLHRFVWSILVPALAVLHDLGRLGFFRKVLAALLGER